MISNILATEKDQSESFKYNKSGDALVFFEYMHEMMPDLLHFEDPNISDLENTSKELSIMRVSARKQAVKKIEELFKIEYLSTSMSEMASYSVSSRSTNIFYVPMHEIIPIIEAQIERKSYLNDVFDGKLPKLMSIALKNDKDKTIQWYQRVLENPMSLVKHEKEIMLLNSPPKYLTF